jgi:hypothetical protein
MTRQRNKEKEREKKNQRKGQKGKNYEQVGLQKAPHYKTRSKTILKMPKAEIPNRNFSLRSNPLVSLLELLKGSLLPSERQ